MKIYLDTNAIRDCLRRRNLNTIRLMEIVRNKKIDCKSSTFSIMELIDNEKDEAFFDLHLKKGEEINKILRKRQERDLKTENLNDIWKDISQLLEIYNFIEFVSIIDTGWKTAFEICRNSNLDADDSIHLASAIGSGCDILLTSDGFFNKEGKRLLEIHNKNSKKDKKVKPKIMEPKKLLETLENN